jgi:hypothetical protein
MGRRYLMQWLFSALLLTLRQFRCLRVVPGTDASVLYRPGFNETAVHLFFSRFYDVDCTGFSNAPAIFTDGERDSSAANPDNCVSLICFCLVNPL